MLRHIKSLLVALGMTTAGVGVAAADEFRGPQMEVYGGGSITVEAQYGQPDYNAYPAENYQPVENYQPADHYQPGPNYVIPSNPGYVAYPQDLRPRRGFTWVPGRYDHRYGRAMYIRGHWERIRPRRGMVWVEDQTVYRNGRAMWIPGHWERARYGWNRGYRYGY